MEQEMADDTVNEEEVQYTFTVYEIDLDYEFDAARFFDFSREESPLEVRQAELWFDSAGSYPPSPFKARLVPREEILMENIYISNSKGADGMTLFESGHDVEADHKISAVRMHHGGKNKGPSSTRHISNPQKFQNQSQKLPSGLNLDHHMVDDVKSDNQTKLSMKPTFPRTSTLMQPTASQLAKQNRTFQAGYSRSHKSVIDKSSKISATGTCMIENQAAKRQKLEGGLLHKFVGTRELHQANLVHKEPKQCGFLDGNMTHTKLRITIPRDPDLETARRAQKTRAKRNKDENVNSTVHRFKALPLNRKILEKPSLLPKRSTPCIPDFQEFYLKTSERAIQQKSAVLKSAVPSNNSDKELFKCTTNLTTERGNRELGRPSPMCNARRADGCQTSHSFKAASLNKKILKSKGDGGVFQNSYKEGIHFPIGEEFSYQSPGRTIQQALLGIRNQLVAKPELKGLQSSISEKVPQGLENRCIKQGNEIKQPAKVELPMLGVKQQT